VHVNIVGVGVVLKYGIYCSDAPCNCVFSLIQFVVIFATVSKDVR